MKYSIRLVNKTSGMLWWKKTKKVYQIVYETTSIKHSSYMFPEGEECVDYIVVSEVDALEEAKLELELWKINEV